MHIYVLFSLHTCTNIHTTSLLRSPCHFPILYLTFFANPHDKFTVVSNIGFDFQTLSGHRPQFFQLVSISNTLFNPSAT